MATYTGTPRTWVAGETVTAALMNSDVRDPLAALSGAWNSYAPTWTNVTVGNATVSGAYVQVGKLVVFRATIAFGSTSAMSTGLPTVSLPATANTTGVLLASAYFYDASATALYSTTTPSLASTTTVSMGVLGTNGLRGNASSSAPFTWTTSDAVTVAGLYEAA